MSTVPTEYWILSLLPSRHCLGPHSTHCRKHHTTSHHCHFLKVLRFICVLSNSNFAWTPMGYICRYFILIDTFIHKMHNEIRMMSIFIPWNTFYLVYVSKCIFYSYFKYITNTYSYIYIAIQLSYSSSALPVRTVFVIHFWPLLYPPLYFTFQLFSHFSAYLWLNV